jgi:4-cresol dehydrogenase (hydroxylating)
MSGYFAVTAHERTRALLPRVPFHRDDPADVARAERAEEALWSDMERAGFAPYRAAVDRIASLVARDLERFDLVARIRSALDPKGVMSPGRYARA